MLICVWLVFELYIHTACLFTFRRNMNRALYGSLKRLQRTTHLVKASKMTGKRRFLRKYQLCICCCVVR